MDLSTISWDFLELILFHGSIVLSMLCLHLSFSLFGRAWHLTSLFSLPVSRILLEEEGLNVVPCARATKLTMNREGIRRLAAEELQLPTSTYRFADSENLFREAVAAIGYPCIVKPVMSSSGKGQTFIRSAEQLAHAWEYAQQGGRAGAGRVIVEGVVKFDFEITLLTVSAVDGVHFCAPVGHRQEDGDYRESWQPQQMSPLALERAQEIARKVVLALGGYGLIHEGRKSLKFATCL